MLVYRINKYIDPSIIHNVHPYDFQDAIDLSRIPTVSMDDIELIWKHDMYLPIVLHYDDKSVYYFIVDQPIPETAEYRRLRLEVFQDPQDHHCDYYVKPLLSRFVGRLQRRLHTRALLELITSNNPYPSTDIEYHVNFLNELERTYVDDLCDRQLLQRMKEESHNIIQAEKDYHPDGIGYKEAKEEFHETMAFSSEMQGMGISASHSQKNLLPADSK
uniref:Uncharacterized protein n=1 Tax=viral metagenome TaxID=1070528 RepID=A0A6C0KV27_9ZZZZ